MKKVDVLYLYEHAARELDVACALASIMRREHGLTVDVVQWPSGFAGLARGVNPTVVLLPFFYTERSYATALLEWGEAVLFNLTWEQLFYEGNIRAKTPRGDFALKHVVHHAWSDGYAKFAAQQSIPNEHIFLNGQPAYTLYEEPYRKYFCQRDELALRHGLDSRKTWVFFPENYNWAFYTDATLKRFIDAGQSADDVREMRDFCANSLSEVMQWCAAAARQDGIELIVRPRPSTSLGEFREVVEALGTVPERMHLIQEGTVREWILASDIVLSSHSTSLIEAAVAGKPAYLVVPTPVPKPLRQPWHDLVRRITDCRQFLDVCTRHSFDERDDRLGMWARSTLMSRGDSIENLAAHIAGIISGEVVRPSAPSKMDSTVPGGIPLPRPLWFLIRKVKGRLRRFRPRRPEAEYTKDLVSPEELTQRIEAWDRLLGHSDG